MTNTHKQHPAHERTKHAQQSQAVHGTEQDHEPAFEDLSAPAHPFEAAPAWETPSSLSAPPARLGYVQRWKRHALGGQPDARNWQRAMKEGWRPRPADSVDGAFDSMKSADGLISVEGLILCEMPVEKARQRETYYAERTARQMQGVDEVLYKAQRPGYPIHKEHQSRTRYGRTPNVAD